MMNIIQVQDDLKNFSEQQLIDEMQSPSGMAPQFLVLSELTRRKRVKEDFNARQAERQPTVAQEAIAAAGMPQEGLPAMAEALAPKSASELSEGVGTSMPMSMRQPMQMQSGGLLSGYDEDMDFSNMSMEEMLEFMQRMKGLSEPMKMRAGGKFVADGRILDAIEFIESGGDPEAINKRTGAAGAYQILDSTALNPGYGVTPISLEDRFDKKKSRKFAKEYLEGIAKANPNFTTDDLIQAYHSGPKNVAEGNIGPEGKKYLTKFYGAMNQKPGGLESFLTKTGLMSTAEAANEGESKKDERSFLDRLLNPKQDKDSMKMVTGSSLSEKEKKGKEDLKETIIGSDPLGFYDKDDKMGSSVPKPLTNYRDLLNLEAASRAEQGFIDPKEVFGGPQVYGEGPIVEKDGKEFVKTKKEGKEILAELDKKGDIKVDKTGKDVTEKVETYKPAPTGDPFQRPDLEQDIIDLQKQLQKDRDVEKWLAIAKTGLAIADPTKTLSEAAESGIDAMTAARKRYTEGVIDLINARSKLLKAGKTGLKIDQLFTNLDRNRKLQQKYSDVGITPNQELLDKLKAEEIAILDQISTRYPAFALPSKASTQSEAG
tara:strand:+ start:426 stop:2225 length:1800 start_codon:yes stop_codon:yes gene_type:complete